MIITSLTTILLYVHSLSQYKIVFCDVGQGAATFLQKNSYQVLIDTGPDSRVLSCIGRHMPFFDHTIEVIIISHNQKDHTGGLSGIQNKYTVDTIIGPSPKPKLTLHTQFIEVINTVVFNIKNIQFTVKKASQNTENLNESANVVTIETPHQIIFLPSDINGIELKSLIPQGVTLLEIPHHGSKYGLYPDSLDLAQPTLAVISVGKKNTYGHPSKEVLDILKAKKIKVWRTDQQGELVVDLN